MLPPNVSPNSVEQQFPRLTKIWWGDEKELKLLPITQMHFAQNLGVRNSSNPVYSYILSGIALLVLFIACVNFITLTLGRQAMRAREVGLRKVVGAGAHADCKPIYRRIALTHHHRAHRWHCHRRTRLANIQQSGRKIPIHERLPQHHNTRLPHFSSSASLASQQGGIPPLSYPDCSRPKS